MQKGEFLQNMHIIILFNKCSRYHGCIANYPKILWHQTAVHYAHGFYGSRIWSGHMGLTFLCWCQGFSWKTQAGDWNYLKNHSLMFLVVDVGIGLGALVPLHMGLSTWTGWAIFGFLTLWWLGITLETESLERSYHLLWPSLGRQACHIFFI